MELLCEFGAEVNCRDKYLYTPLHVAAALGHVNVAKQLMDRGAELDAVTARVSHTRFERSSGNQSGWQ